MSNNLRLGWRARSIAAALVWYFAGVAAAQPATAQLKGTIYGHSAAGFMVIVGEAVAEAIRREYPDSAIDYQPGNPIGGIRLVADGEYKYAMVSTTDLAIAARGEPPFPRAYAPGEVGAIARLVDSMAIHVYLRREFLTRYGIETLADLARRKPPLRVSTNRPGNLMAQRLAIAILHYYGTGYEEIESWGGEVFYLATRESNDLMRDAKLDMMITATPIGGGQLDELMQAVDIRFFGLEPALIEQLQRDLALEPTTIPADSYPGQTQPLPTAAAFVLLVGGKALPQEEAYRVTGALYRQFAAFQSIHPVLARQDRARLGDTGGVPYHPGAARFYRELSPSP